MNAGEAPPRTTTTTTTTTSNTTTTSIFALLFRNKKNGSRTRFILTLFLLALLIQLFMFYYWRRIFNMTTSSTKKTTMKNDDEKAAHQDMDDNGHSIPLLMKLVLFEERCNVDINNKNMLGNQQPQRIQQQQQQPIQQVTNEEKTTLPTLPTTTNNIYEQRQHSLLRHYVQYHTLVMDQLIRKQSSSPHASHASPFSPVITNHHQFLIFRPHEQSGFGNIVMGLVSSFIYAMISGRVFLIDWNVNGYRGCRAHLNDLLQAPTIHSSSDGSSSMVDRMRSINNNNNNNNNNNMNDTRAMHSDDNIQMTLQWDIRALPENVQALLLNNREWRHDMQETTLASTSREAEVYFKCSRHLHQSMFATMSSLDHNNNNNNGLATYYCNQKRQLLFHDGGCNANDAIDAIDDDDDDSVVDDKKSGKTTMSEQQQVDWQECEIKQGGNDATHSGGHGDEHPSIRYTNDIHGLRLSRKKVHYLEAAQYFATLLYADNENYASLFQEWFPSSALLLYKQQEEANSDRQPKSTTTMAVTTDGSDRDMMKNDAANMVDVFGPVSRWLLQLTDPLQSLVKQYSMQVFGKKMESPETTFVLGIQIRKNPSERMFKGTPVSTFWQCAKDRIMKLQASNIRDVLLFVTTDFEPAFGEGHRWLNENRAEFSFLNSVQMVRTPKEPSVSTNSRSKDSVKHAVVEMWLLMQADDLIVSEKSTFGHVVHGIKSMRPLVVLASEREEPTCQRAPSPEPLFHLRKRANKIDCRKEIGAMKVAI